MIILFCTLKTLLNTLFTLPLITTIPSVECVARITGCSYGDVSCAERHAYQRFLLGPMLANVSNIVEPRLHGFSAKFRRGLFTLPHHFMPRIDLSIHLRAQFYHFEGNNHNARYLFSAVDH